MNDSNKSLSNQDVPKKIKRKRGRPRKNPALDKSVTTTPPVESEPAKTTPIQPPIQTTNIPPKRFQPHKLPLGIFNTLNTSEVPQELDSLFSTVLHESLPSSFFTDQQSTDQAINPSAVSNIKSNPKQKKVAGKKNIPKRKRVIHRDILKQQIKQTRVAHTRYVNASIALEHLFELYSLRLKTLESEQKSLESHVNRTVYSADQNAQLDEWMDTFVDFENSDLPQDSNPQKVSVSSATSTPQERDSQIDSQLESHRKMVFSNFGGL